MLPNKSSLAKNLTSIACLVVIATQVPHVNGFASVAASKNPTCVTRQANHESRWSRRLGTARNVPLTTQLASSQDEDSSSQDSSNKDATIVSPKDEEFQGTVNPLRLAVLKLGLTELKFTSPLNYEKRIGSYNCASCGSYLFDLQGKYDSGSGWPSFWKTTGDDRVALKQEWDGRVECSCKNCGGHLGHVFPDGPQRKSVPKEELVTIPENDLRTSVATNEASRLPRYCVNGASLKFQER